MKTSYILAGVIGVAAVAWVASGQFGAKDAAPQGAASVAVRMQQAGEDAPLTSVRASRFTARPYQQAVVVRGRTQAVRRVEVRSEVKGRIVEIGAAKGAVVKQGDVLARIEMSDRQARLDEARALVRQREMEFKAAEQLHKKGFRAGTQYAANAAQLDAARAQVKRIQVEIANTVIRAPFDGVVDERAIEVGDYVEPKSAIATVVDRDPFLVIAQVSENDVGKLKVGHPGTAALVTGEALQGRIRYIASTADSETRTFRVELEVPNREGTLRDGVTAELRFPTGEVMAHFITPAVLTLDDEGRVGVRILDDDDTVAFHAIHLVGSEADGVWITGLPEVVRIITVGQEFVRAGDRVRVSAGAGTGAS
ncbi:MAG TPA: efflux RND transporter periplasmic adaptor subunit [Alphaproteobacteria bacterium]|jgi:multidrug efflux system membrane fusion protein|nr:efflux RND transporter periplasmic adaptor subunit [Alphaproteobacteria bacterium]